MDIKENIQDQILFIEYLIVKFNMEIEPYNRSKNNSTRYINKTEIFKEKILPVLLLTSNGMFSWAIRGQAGFGSIPGCMFAGLLWGLTWRFLSHPEFINNNNNNNINNYKRRYNSGWIVLAMLLGVGFSGMQGWAQWPEWVKGIFYLDTTTREYITIQPYLGYLWWFIVAIHWGGLGAVGIAWTSPEKKLSKKDWLIRIIFGFTGTILAYIVAFIFPNIIFPFYEELDGYNTSLCPHCKRVYNDNLAALMFLGLYLGFLGYEIFRKDYNNVKMIAFVGIFSGMTWPLLQFWQFAPMKYPDLPINWWRCWETSAGAALGLAYGLAFVLFNPKIKINEDNRETDEYIEETDKKIKDISKEIKKNSRELVFGEYLGISLGVAYSTTHAITGYLNIYYGLDNVLIGVMLPILGLSIIIWFILSMPYITNLKNSKKEKIKNMNIESLTPFVQFYPIYLILYFFHRILGLLVTGPLTSISELQFFIYYLILTILDILLIITWVKLSNK